MEQIEELFGNAIKSLRQFVNCQRKANNDNIYVGSHLTSLIKYINILHRIDSRKSIDSELSDEFKKLTHFMTVKTKNDEIYQKKMQRNIDYLSWVNQCRKINLSSRTYTVAQGEIFYAQLGDNIGSEQNGRRPIVILQNNTGNIKGNTTIIAPVTTHQKQIRYDNQKHKYYIKQIRDGIKRKKYLDFYEVPLRLKNNPDGLYGFVNVMHIREIDRKRIDSNCLGITTDNCFSAIQKAIVKNLS